MAQPYPLYDELLKRVQQRGDKGVDIDVVVDTINEISLHLAYEQALKHYYEIGWLIFHYATVNNGGVMPSTFPFDPKIMIGGKGILNYMTNLPPLLQQIISQYIEDEANPQQR